MVMAMVTFNCPVFLTVVMVMLFVISDLTISLPGHMVQISSEASCSNEKNAIFDHFRDRSKIFTDTQQTSKMPGNPDV